MKISGINFVDEYGFHSSAETLVGIDLIASQLDCFHGRAVIMESERSLKTALRFLALLSKQCDVLMLPTEEFHNPEFFGNVTGILGPVYKWSLNDELPVTDGAGDIHPALTGSHFIVKTSGTSGMKNKFVLHDPELFFQKFSRRNPDFEKTLNFFPPDSIAGIETLIEAMVHGKTLVNPGKTPDPAVISGLIIKENIDFLHVTPTFLNVLMVSGNLLPEHFQHVKKIAFGSEPAQSTVIDQLMKIAPNTSFRQIFGMSEIGLQSTLPHDEPSWFRLDSKLNPYRVENGQLIIKSQTPMITYLNHDKKISDGWFETGDTVFEKDDALRVIGRSDDVINVAGKKFHPIELEEILMEVDGVLDVMVTSEPHDLIGNVVIANFTCTSPGDDFRAKLKLHLEQNVPSWMRPQKVLFTSGSELSARLKKRRKSSV